MAILLTEDPGDSQNVVFMIRFSIAKERLLDKRALFCYNTLKVRRFLKKQMTYEYKLSEITCSNYVCGARFFLQATWRVCCY